MVSAVIKCHFSSAGKLGVRTKTESYLPLRAQYGHEAILAFEHDDESWENLKSNYKDMGLLMPCCNSKAIPKTSKLGNYYFSHSVKVDCTSEAESQEHLYIKGLVAKTAKELGWDVTTEWQEKTPTGEQWVADVFCQKGKAKVVFEIQLSRQTKKETIARQNRYKDSGVRCAWLASNTVFDSSYISPNKETPFFLISKPIMGEIPVVDCFNISLDNFIVSLLSGTISWVEEPWAYDIQYIEDMCWKCKKQNKQVFGYSFGVHYNRAKTVPNASTILNEIADIADSGELNALGLNSIGEFNELKGNAPNFPFCNVCFHCGSPQNNYYLLEKLTTNPKVKWVELHSKKDFSGSWVALA